MPSFVRYILNRFLLTVIALIGVTIIVFMLTHLLPSNPASLRAGPLANKELIAQYEQEMGLDKPLVIQFIDYAGLLLKGDLGDSWRTGQPVLEELAVRVPATLELALTAFFIALFLGLTLGIAAAVFSGTWIDQAARIFATFGASMALFWLALVGVHIFYFQLKIAPPPLGRVSIGVTYPPRVTGLFLIDSILSGQIKTLQDALNHLWLPAFTLAFVVCAPILKIVRASMLDALNSDFIRTARAIGVPMGRVILGDALRNALIPVLTMLGIVFGYLMAGNLVVEQVFSWPGIGQYAWKALITNDFNAVQGFVLLIAIVYVLLNFFIDIAYAIVDPRIRLE